MTDALLTSSQTRRQGAPARSVLYVQTPQRQHVKPLTRNVDYKSQRCVLLTYLLTYLVYLFTIMRTARGVNFRPALGSRPDHF